MPFQPILPTWLAVNAANDTSASGQVDLRTGQPVNAGGLNQGDYFDLTNKEAAQLSDTSIGTLYFGRYRRVLVDSGATAANVKTGTIGLMPSLAAVTADGASTTPAPSANIVTSYDQSIGLAVGLRPVVFLNSITPGNFGFVQELGVASVLGGATLQKATPVIGDFIDSATSGVVNDLTAQAIAKTSLGLAIDTPKPNLLFRIVMQFVPIVQD
jgi:hypothetical protein